MINDNISKVNISEGQAKQFLNWTDYITYMNTLTNFTKDDSSIKTVYGIPRGGLFIATQISYKLNIPLLLKEEEITSSTLIVDDIVDSGKTIDKLFDKLEKQNIFSKENRPKVFAMFYREHTASFNPTKYAKKLTNDDWIIFPYE